MNEKEMIITDAMTLKHVEHSLMEGSGWKTAPRSCPEGRGACWERSVRVGTVTPEGLLCGSRNRRLNSPVSKDTRRCRFQLRGGENKTNNRNLSPESQRVPPSLRRCPGRSCARVSSAQSLGDVTEEILYKRLESL